MLSLDPKTAFRVTRSTETSNAALHLLLTLNAIAAPI
jgi:hypothetical protein